MENPRQATAHSREGDPISPSPRRGWPRPGLALSLLVALSPLWGCGEAPLEPEPAAPVTELASSVIGPVQQVSAGGSHNCALNSDGTVECWGLNTSGQASPPAEVFVDVSAGFNHACGVRDDGTVECWGVDFFGESSPPPGSFSSVAAGSRQSCGIRPDETIACWGSTHAGESTPPSGSFLQISGGHAFNCAIRTQGTLACWGTNTSGQASPPAGVFVDVSAGLSHACGVRNDGAVLCWGDLSGGRADIPTGPFARVASGRLHTCGLRSDGSLDCWGDDTHGRATPPGGTFVDVSAGLEHTCALSVGGEVRCWGSNEQGQTALDHGPSKDVSVGDHHTCWVGEQEGVSCWGSNHNGQLDAPESGRWSAVGAGGDHTCALADDGSIACWGLNHRGQTNSPGSGTYFDIALGRHHSCALRDDGVARCWGYNAFGQASPPAGATFKQIDAGGISTCGVEEDGTLACWGRINAFSGMPTGTFQHVAVEQEHACAVRTDGSLACWGFDLNGRASPPAGAFQRVTTGRDHSCGIRTDGTVACWGLDSDGRASPPDKTFLTVSAGGGFTCGVGADERVECWGRHKTTGFIPGDGTGGGATATPVGSDVSVWPDDATTGEPSPVTVTFESVIIAGETAAASGTVGQDGEPAAPPRALFRLGAPPTFYDVTTTASFEGTVEVCVMYTASSWADPSRLRLLHDAGSGWVDVTTSLDTDVGTVCGTVTSLSPFLVVQENARPSLDLGGPYHTTEGSPLEAFAHVAADDDGDEVTIIGWDFGNGQSGSGTPETPHYVEDGSYTITMTVRDAPGAETTGTTDVTVANAPPVILGLGAPVEPVEVGISAALTLSFTDAGTLDTHDVVVDWGDGSTSSASVDQGAGSGSAADAHIYAAPGVHTLTATVEDDDGGSTSEEHRYVVVYDPSAGFVTGGGWIHSPEGAYAADPSLQGKASFGFVSRYRRGANQPDGHARFRFRTAGLDFQSADFEWLVIAGARAQFKGTGTINGSGSYGFMITGVDGEAQGPDRPDRLRMKIWDLQTEAIVYDNEPGATDDAEPATVLGGGRIVIHAK